MCALRQEKMQNWLLSLSGYQIDLSTVIPASSDASFRRYFRVTDLLSRSTFIVMDAPPDKEDVPAFVRVAQSLGQAHINAPVVLSQNLSDGFLLLTDFGSTTMLQALNGKLAEPEQLYRQAIDVLVNMQLGTSQPQLPVYGREKLQQEMDLFDDWFVGKHHNATLTVQEKTWLDQIKNILIQSALAEGQVFVHRDYHCRNLMFIQDQSEGAFDFGVLDFQDALSGPLSYDLVSLLRDAYVEWPEEVTLDWVIRYWEKARKAGLPVPDDVGDFYRQFDFMGLQRHLKILGIFARLNYRDGKAQYMNDLPLVQAYVRNVAARYIAFKPLLLILDRLEDKAQQVGYTF
jgi:aminoglycoside/choline kinase family phosphotransferase